MLNKEGRAKFDANPPQLDAFQQNILDTVSSDGIAITHLDELFPNENMLEKLQAYEQSLRSDLKQNNRKPYVHYYWDLTPELDFNNPFLNVAIDERVLGIANAYTELYTRLIYFRLEQTRPVGDAAPSYSQNWHRDPNEGRYLKMFIYLNDVDENSGPFTYIPKSTHGNKYGHLFPQKPPQGTYPDPQELESLIPKDEWLVATGKAGSVIFCDTTGLHKGGYVKENTRIMTMNLYAANSYSKVIGYKKPQMDESTLKSLSPAQRYAIFL